MRLGSLALIVALAACEATPGRPDETVLADPLIELHIAHDEPASGRSLAQYEGETIYLEPDPVLTDRDFDGLSASAGSGRVALVICVKRESLGRLRARTSAAIGARLALVIDARVRAAPLIRDGGGPRIRAQIDMPGPEAERLAERIGARWLGCS